MLDYTLFILGNGRKPYLERTIRSWETNIIGQPKHKIIFDDSGNPEYIKYLNERFGDRFLIVPIGDKPMGHSYAMQFIFNYLKDIDTDYIFELEEDWVLFRKLEMSGLIHILEKNNKIVQARVPRTITNDNDVKYGSTLSWFILHEPTNARFIADKNIAWYEWRGQDYFWSHNPSMFRKSIINYPYSQSKGLSHENDFGKTLLNADQDHVVASYSSNIYDAYIQHIGNNDESKIRYAEEFDIFSIDL